MTKETPTTPFFPLSYPRAFPFSPPENTVITGADTASPYIIGKLCRFDRTLSGKGTKIAFVCAFGSPTLQSDLDEFCRTHSLQKRKISIHYPLGTPLFFTDSWTAESSLCSQWIHAFCPNAELFAVFSPTDSIYDLASCAKYASDELCADVVCMSFGCDEFRGQKELSAYFLKNCGKTVFVAASGNNCRKVFFPGTGAGVLCVGQSYSRVNPETGERVGLEYASEACSGGVSEYEKAPAHQRIFKGISDMSGEMRACPDFCMCLPSNITVCTYISGKGFTKANGTSLCCALGTCLCSHVLEKNSPSLDRSNLARYFYALAGGVSYSKPQYYFNDITFGGNAKHRAKEGWDFCTGLGSANGALLAKG